MEKFKLESNQPAEKEKEKVPESEIEVHFSRSGGSGGQNVNKLSTKAEVRWNVGNSRAFTAEEKERIKQFLRNRINQKGELIVVSQEERSQLQNRQRAVERLNELVARSLTSDKERVPTKPTRASKERRLEQKRLRGERKSLRSQKVE